MTAEDAPNFLGRLNALAELFDAKFSEVKQQMYFETLKDLAMWDVERALSEAAKTCTFMPKPAELRLLALGDPQECAEQAWVEFRNAARRIGGYHDWMPDEPEVAQAIIDVFGSWPRACGVELTPEMWASKRKEFLGSYKRNYLQIRNVVLSLSGQFSMDQGKPALKTITDLALLESSNE